MNTYRITVKKGFKSESFTIQASNLGEATARALELGLKSQGRTRIKVKKI